MLRLLADENIPRKLVVLLKKLSIGVIRLQDLGVRGISGKELIDIAYRLKRTILTRDSDFTTLDLLPLIRSGVVYLSYQPSRDVIPRIAEMIASIAHQLEPKCGLLIVVNSEYIEVFD